MRRQGESSQAANDMLPPECQMPVNQWKKGRPLDCPWERWEQKKVKVRGEYGNTMYKRIAWKTVAL